MRDLLKLSRLRLDEVDRLDLFGPRLRIAGFAVFERQKFRADRSQLPLRLNCPFVHCGQQRAHRLVALTQLGLLCGGRLMRDLPGLTRRAAKLRGIVDHGPHKAMRAVEAWTSGIGGWPHQLIHHCHQLGDLGINKPHTASISRCLTTATQSACTVSVDGSFTRVTATARTR